MITTLRVDTTPGAKEDDSAPRYVDKTPAELLARRARVIIEKTDEAAEETAAAHLASQAAAQRARAFSPTVERASYTTTDGRRFIGDAPTVQQETSAAPVATSDYPDDVPGFNLASDAGIYLPRDGFSGEAPRYSREALDVATSLGKRPARVLAFNGPSDTGMLGASVPAKGTESGHKGEGSFLPRGIMREQIGNVGGEAIEAVAMCRKAHRKAKKTGPAIVRRAVPLYRIALLTRGKPCRASRLSPVLVHPLSLAPSIDRSSGALSKDGSHFRRRAVVTRAASSAHVPSYGQALRANETERKERREH